MTKTTPYSEWDIRDLLASMKRVKAMYIKERNARRPAYRLWNEYSRLLHAVRLHKRASSND